MAKFKPSHDVRGKKEKNKLFEAGKEIEMTIKRAEELTDNIHKIAKEDEVYSNYADFEMVRTDKEDKETDKE